GYRSDPEHSGPECGLDGHHDARDGWLPNHARNPQRAEVPRTADLGPDRQGYERRPGEVPSGRRLGLQRKTGKHRATALAIAGVAVSVAVSGPLSAISLLPGQCE